jgi:hypothetical protein
MSQQPVQPQPEKQDQSNWAAQALLVDTMRQLQRRVGRLTAAVLLMTLLLILTVASVFGSLANYFGGDATLYGGSTVGAALLGFGLGYAAGRLRGR